LSRPKRTRVALPIEEEEEVQFCTSMEHVPVSSVVQNVTGLTTPSPALVEARIWIL